MIDQRRSHRLLLHRPPVYLLLLWPLLSCLDASPVTYRSNQLQFAVDSASLHRNLSEYISRGRKSQLSILLLLLGGPNYRCPLHCLLVQYETGFFLWGAPGGGSHNSTRQTSWRPFSDFDTRVIYMKPSFELRLEVLLLKQGHNQKQQLYCSWYKEHLSILSCHGGPWFLFWCWGADAPKLELQLEPLLILSSSEMEPGSAPSLLNFQPAWDNLFGSKKKTKRKWNCTPPFPIKDWGK